MKNDAQYLILNPIFSYLILSNFLKSRKFNFVNSRYFDFYN